MKRLAILMSIVFTLAVASTASAQWVRVYRAHHYRHFYYAPHYVVHEYVPYCPPPVAYYPAPVYGGVSFGFGFRFGGHFHHRF